ncbi:MAG: hypothetical protein ACQEW8_09615, partial [Actinomycetota bacterium]
MLMTPLCLGAPASVRRSADERAPQSPATATTTAGPDTRVTVGTKEPPVAQGAVRPGAPDL